MDKKKKELFLNLFAFVVSPLIIVAGAVIVTLTENNRTVAAGALVILFGVAVILFRGYFMLVRYVVNKDKAKEENKTHLERKRLIDDARQAFESNPDRPETNTIKLPEAGVEFFAEGRYACEKDFKNIVGNHFAFEISSTDLKAMPEDRETVSYLERTGILVEVGYINGDALAEYANDNGVILQDTLENSIGSTITLKSDDGYNAYVWTAEGDDIDYGFVKILGLKNDVLTVYFSLTVPYGICDTAEGVICRTVEGVVELKKDAVKQEKATLSLIDKIKRKQLNTSPIGDREAQSIKQANPFLPDSYITFLKEIGYIDFNWMDGGRNEKAPTDSDDDRIADVNDVITDNKNLDVDDYYFIGVDNDGRHYAFSKNADDKKVHVFSDDASEIATYETFEKFISEILSV